MFVQKRGALNRDYPKRTILFQSLSFFRGHLNFWGGAFCSSTLNYLFFFIPWKAWFFQLKKIPSKKHDLGSMITYFNDGEKIRNKNMSQPPKRLKLKTSEVPMFKNFKWIVGMEPTCDLIICQKCLETNLQKPNSLAFLPLIKSVQNIRNSRFSKVM